MCMSDKAGIFLAFAINIFTVLIGFGIFGIVYDTEVFPIVFNN